MNVRTVGKADHISELAEVRDNLRAEANTIDRLIRQLTAAEASTRRELHRFELGEQLGATKLARLLGCSRTHASKLMTTEFAHAVRTTAAGTRWVPREAVESWLSGREEAVA